MTDRFLARPFVYYTLTDDALKILKPKYGRALLDVIPTEDAHLYFFGNLLSAPEICKAARRNLWTEHLTTRFTFDLPTRPEANAAACWEERQ
ncbi:MAG: hypothetical protein JOZ08_08275 [Verrucomicrobia bacterium]|nr:hypothetical protein [Verrucomicrobiota bacterium]